MASVAAAADQPPAPQKSEKPGAVVFIDPATGKIRQPEASEIGGLTKSTPTVGPKAAQPAMIQGAGGAVGVVLGEESLSYAVATVAPDGKVAVDCVSGSQPAGKPVTTTSDSKAKDSRDAKAPR